MSKKFKQARNIQSHKAQKTQNQKTSESHQYGGWIPTTDDQRMVLKLWYETVRRRMLTEQAMAEGDPIARPENYVDGNYFSNSKSFIRADQGIYRDSDDNYALDVQISPEVPDILHILGKDVPFLHRETIHISMPTAASWLRANVDDLKPLVKSDPGIVPCETRTIYRLPEGAAHPDTFIIGRAFEHPGTINSQECLYGRADKTLYLELTYTISDLHLTPENAPYVITMTAPLTEEAADLWVRWTGAPDNAPAMFCKTFRALWTNLPPYDIH